MDVLFKNGSFLKTRLKIVLELNLKCYFQSIDIFFRVTEPLNRVFDSYAIMNLVRLDRSIGPRSILLMSENGLSTSHANKDAHLMLV